MNQGPAAGYLGLALKLELIRLALFKVISPNNKLYLVCSIGTQTKKCKSDRMWIYKGL